MKTLLLILLIPALCLGQERSSDFTVNYDKFDLSTSIRGEFVVDILNTSGKLVMVATANIPDNGKPTLMLYFYRSEKYLFDRPDLRFLVNGRLLEYSSKDIDYSTLFTIPYYDFDRIAKGKTVEFKLSIFEAKLTEEHLRAFKKLVELAKPKPPPDR